jgi:hypothetical protein
MADKSLEARVRALEYFHRDHHDKLDQLTSPAAQGRGHKLATFEIAIHDLIQRLEALEEAERRRSQS